MEPIEKKAPADAMQEGRCHCRGMKPIKSHWRDNISKECNGFNRKPMLVHSSDPTGCNEQDKVNVAVAIHLRKVDRMECKFNSFEAKNWKHCNAWLAQRTQEVSSTQQSE